MKSVASLLLGITVLYLVFCSGLSAIKSRAFESIKLGDSRKSVIDAIGAPDFQELPDELFARYASQPCESNCKERLWFENKLSFRTEAWSVELDEKGHVIHKAYWLSP